uniref:Uncharacterized protein n=1 Tax=Myripristis murdjan TaxID=586833 RepID=A0A667YTB8_9TELE
KAPIRRGYLSIWCVISATHHSNRTVTEPCTTVTSVFHSHCPATVYVVYQQIDLGKCSHLPEDTINNHMWSSENH